MPRISKRDLILESIIKAYLEENLPIGSSELGTRMTHDIPASTIRVYFKKLSEEGELTQLHISGGRIPTDQAMKQYWHERINVEEPFVIRNPETLKGLVERHGIYCMINAEEEATFNELINVENRFLLLVIGSHEIVLNYSDQVARYLPNIIGATLTELQEISAQVGLYELYDKVELLLSNKVLFKEGEMTVYDMAKEKGQPNTFRLVLDPGFPESLTDGIYFEDILPEGYMAVKQPAIFKGQEAQMLCLGGLYTDFESFFNKTKEEA